MKHLTHGTRVRHANWTSPHYVEVATEWGIALEAGTDPEEAERLALARRGALVTSQYDNNLARKVEKPGHGHIEQRWDKATILADGETVMVDGRRYAVRYNPGNKGAKPMTAVPIRFLLEGAQP